MEETIEKIELTEERYHAVKGMLHSSDEDFNLGLELLGNMQIRPILLTLLAKNLMYQRRTTYLQKFRKEMQNFIDKGQPVGIGNISLKFGWKHLFKLIKENDPDDIEKKIVSEEYSKMIMQTLESLEYDFVKTCKFELKWT